MHDSNSPLETQAHHAALRDPQSAIPDPRSPIRHPRSAIGATVLLLLLATAPASAQSTPAEEASSPITVASVQLEGVKALDEALVRGAMQTKAPSWIPFSKKPIYRAAALEEDAARIRALYIARGFPNVRVTRVAADVDPEKRTSAIVVTIDEGAPRRAGDVAFEGFGNEDAERLSSLPEQAGYKRGEPLEHAWVEHIREGSLHQLREGGFAQAEVEVRESEAEDAAINLTFVAVPGPRMRIGTVDFVGLSAVDEKLVRRRLAFKPGDAFRQSRIDQTERALRALELFDFAYVQPRRAEASGDQMPVRVTVAEGRHRRTDLGVGYGTEDQARGQASWRNVNVGGRGRTVGFEGRASALEWGARANVLEPHVFTRHFSFGATAHWWYENEPIYRKRTYGGRGTLTWQHDTRDIPRQRGTLSSVGLTVINDYTRYSVSDFALADDDYRGNLIALGLNPETGEGQGTLVALRLQVQRSSVLNPLDAQQGTAVTLAVERAGGPLSGDFAYTEVTGEARAYRSVRGVVLAVRGGVGSITGAKDAATVPFFKRYFLGGSGSLRGWGRYDVSPLTESGLPIGGLSLFEGSAEARVPVTSSLSLVAFVDAGNVWATRKEIDLSDLRVSVGPGLRYATPIGPVRMDFGYQLTPIDGLVVRGKPEQRHWRIHVSIGQAF